MKNSMIHNFGLLFLRIAFSGMMLFHGVPKLLKLLAGNFEFIDLFGLGALNTLILAILGEVIFPILVIVGFKTRITVIPIIITMAGAAFMIHANDPFEVKEKALLFLIGFISIAILGPGKYSVDRK